MSSEQPNSMNHRNQLNRQKAMCVQLTQKEVEFHCIQSKSFYLLASDSQLNLVSLGFYTAEVNSAFPLNSWPLKLWRRWTVELWVFVKGDALTLWLTNNTGSLQRYSCHVFMKLLIGWPCSSLPRLKWLQVFSFLPNGRAVNQWRTIAYISYSIFSFCLKSCLFWQGATCPSRKKEKIIRLSCSF